MNRKSIYIETSIVSYLASRASRDLVAAAWQEVTREFWVSRRAKYDLFTSEIVVAEASAGMPNVAARRIDLLRGIPELLVDDPARKVAEEILRNGILPQKATADALHIGVAAAHAIDYLLTWNCRHLNNPATKPRVRRVCARLGYDCPEICTPFELMEG